MEFLTMIEPELGRKIVFVSVEFYFVIVFIHDSLPVLTQEVFFPFTERFNLLGLFVHLPFDYLSRLILFVAEPVVTAGDRVIVPRVATFKVEGANVTNELDVVVVEATHPRQILKAVDFSFG